MCLSIVLIICHFGAVQILHIVSLRQLAGVDLLCQGIVRHKRASGFHCLAAVGGVHYSHLEGLAHYLFYCDLSSSVCHIVRRRSPLRISALCRCGGIMYSNDLTTTVAVPALLHRHGVPLLPLGARVDAGAAPQLLAAAGAVGGGDCHEA